MPATDDRDQTRAQPQSLGARREELRGLMAVVIAAALRRTGVRPLLSLMERFPGVGAGARRRLAECCALAGEYGTAAALLEAELARLVEAPPRGVVKQQQRGAAAAAVAAQAPVALADVLARLRGAGIEPFLTFGTLLGAVREGRVIAGDLDLDLGVFADETDIGRLRRLFQEPGGKLTVAARTRVLPSAYQIFLRHRSSGIIFDIVPFERRPDAFVTRLEAGSRIIERCRRPFGLTQIGFLGQQVAVPNPPEAFLEETYGPGWRTPDRHYNQVLSSNMPVDPAEPLFRFFVFSGLVRAGLRGESERLRVLAERALARGFGGRTLEQVVHGAAGAA